MAQKSKYLPEVDVNNKVFCMAPFVHMYITPSEPEEKICCQAQPHALNANFNLENRWTGSKIQSIRQQMTDNFEVANGEIAHLCSRCIEQEKRGDISDRIMYKEKYDYVKTDIRKGNSFGSPLDLDLRPSNLCNLQCRMCNSSFSSQIQKEISKSNGLIDFMGEVKINVSNFWFTDENINFLLKNLHRGEWTRIKFLGGEPTIMPEVRHILDLLIEQKLTHVVIAITTNLTNVNKEFLDKLAKFEMFTVQYSIDGIGKTVEYIRYPVSWNSIQTNIEIWQNIKPHWSSINFTLQAYNLHNMKDLIAWADSIGVEYLINMVWSNWDNIYVLPYEYRKKYLEDINSNITNDILQDTKQDSIIKFVRHTKILDKSRKQHIKNYIPELWEVISKDYLALQI